METDSLSEKIRNLSASIGIDVVGFTEASEFSGYALSSSRRRDPKLSLSYAKSIIVAGVYIGGFTLPAWGNPLYGRTSRLYLSKFFLDVVKPLKPIVTLLKNHGYKAIVCDDSREKGSILPLKLAAARAGLGWQGKHTLLLSKKYGTFLALGGIITDAPLEHNFRQEPDRCHECEKCQRACPSGALDKPYVLNIDRCLSNLLQIEHLPEEAQAAMGNRVVDCEICQEACPWNRKHLDRPMATGRTQSFLKKIEDWEKLFYLPDLVDLSEEGYREKLGPLNTGISYGLFHRNVLIAWQRAKTSGTTHKEMQRVNEPHPGSDV